MYRVIRSCLLHRLCLAEAEIPLSDTVHEWTWSIPSAKNYRLRGTKQVQMISMWIGLMVCLSVIWILLNWFWTMIICLSTADICRYCFCSSCGAALSTSLSPSSGSGGAVPRIMLCTRTTMLDPWTANRSTCNIFRNLPNAKQNKPSRTRLNRQQSLPPSKGSFNAHSS